MKVLSLALLVATAAFAVDLETTEPDVYFGKPGSVWIYKFDSQVLTGIPMSDKNVAGNRLQYMVKFVFGDSPSSRRNCIMKIHKVLSSGDISDRITGDWRKMQDPKHFEKFNLLEEELEMLKKPVSFKYEPSGVISNIMVSPEEADWSLNIKKSIIQLLQVKLSPSSKDLSNERISHTSKIYRRQEDGLTGRCETIYSVQKEPICRPEASIPNPIIPEDERFPSGPRFEVNKILNKVSGKLASRCVPRFTVTKTKNFNNCEMRPVYNNSIPNTRPCADCVYDEKSIMDTNTEIRMRVVGSSEQFSIESVKLVSEHRVSPFHQTHGSMITSVTTQLELINVKMDKIYRSLEESLPSAPEKITLLMTNPKLEQLRHLAEGLTTKVEGKDHIEVAKRSVKAVLKEIVESSTPKEHRAIPEMLIVLQTEILPKLSRNELNAVINEYLNIDSKMSTLFFDVLPTVRSTHVCSHCLELIKNEKVSKSRIQSMATSMALSCPPTKELIKGFKSVCSSTPLTNFGVKRTVCLAYSTLVSKVCRPNTDKSESWMHIKRSICTPSFLESHISFIEAKLSVVFTKSESLEEKLLPIKMAGNMGLPQFLPTLKRIITHRCEPSLGPQESVVKQNTYCTHLRIAALNSLRLIAPLRPRVIREMMLPIVTDQREVPELRVVAYKVLMMCYPDVSTMNIIASTINHDRSNYVANYIYSHLWTLSRSNDVCSKNLVNKALWALKRITKVIRPEIFSKGFHFGWHSDKLKMGGLLDLSLIREPESLLPRGGNAKFNFNLFGRNVNLFEFGFHSEGLRQVWERFLGPMGSFETTKSPLDLVKKSTPFTGYTHETTEELLKVSSRNPDSYISGGFFYRIGGSELNFNTFNRKTFDSILKTGVFNVPSKIWSKIADSYPIKFERVFTMPQMFYMVPTETGFPLYLNLSMAGHAKVHGSMKLNEPKDNKVVGKLSLEPKMTAQLQGDMGIYTLKTKLGLSIRGLIRTEIPVKMTGELSLMKKSIFSRFSFEGPEKTRNLVDFEVKPFVFKYKYNPDSQLKMPYIHKKTLTGLNVCTPEKKEYSFGKMVSGWSFHVKTSTVDRLCSAHPIFHPLVGLEKLSLSVKPTEVNSPKMITFEFLYDRVKTTVNENIYSIPSSDFWKTVNEYKEPSDVRESIIKKRYESGRPSDDSLKTGEYVDSWETDSSSLEESTVTENRKSWESEPISSHNPSLRWWKETPSTDKRLISPMIKKARKHTWILRICSAEKCSKSLETSSTYESGLRQMTLRLRVLRNWITDKLNFEIFRTPYSSEESKVWKLYVHGIMHKPLAPESLFKRLPESVQQLFKHLTISYGTELENSINIWTRWSKSLEQKHDDKIVKSRLYSTCLKDRRNGNPISKSCRLVAELESTLKKMTTIIKFNKLSKPVHKRLQFWCTRLEGLLAPYLGNVKYSDNLEGQIVIKSVQGKGNKIRYLTVMTPKRTTIYKDIRMPYSIPCPSYRRSYSMVLLKAITGHNEYPNTCSARYSTVNTFDGVEVPLYSNCPFVLTKDCSKSRLFSISLRSAHHNVEGISVSGKGQKQILDISLNVPGHKRHFQFYYTTKSTENIHSSSNPLRFESTSSSSEVPMKAFVKIVGGSHDGKFMPAEYKNSFEKLNEKVSKFPSQKYWTIMRISPRVLIFKSPVLGITVRYDMKSTDVSLTSTPWSSKVCGMCGDFNGETTDEYKTPSGRVAKDSKTFYFSNSLYSDKLGDRYDPSETPICSVGSGKHIPSRSSLERETYHNVYRPESWIKISENKECKMMKRPVIRNLFSSEHKPLICVSHGSEHMIKSCSLHCSYSIPKTTKVELLCIPREKVYELGFNKILSNLGEKFNSPNAVSDELSEMLNNVRLVKHSITKSVYVNEDSKCYY